MLFNKHFKRRKYYKGQIKRNVIFSKFILPGVFKKANSEDLCLSRVVIPEYNKRWKNGSKILGISYLTHLKNYLWILTLTLLQQKIYLKKNSPYLNRDIYIFFIFSDSYIKLGSILKWIIAHVFLIESISAIVHINHYFSLCYWLSFLENQIVTSSK